MPGPICESQLSLSWGVHNACMVQSCRRQFLVKLALSQSAIVALIYVTTHMPSNSLLAQRIPNGFLRNRTLFQHSDLFQFVKLTERSFLNTRHKIISTINMWRLWQHYLSSFISYIIQSCSPDAILLLLYRIFYFLFIDNFRRLRSCSSEYKDYGHLDCQQTFIGSFCFSRIRHFSG